MTVRTERDLLGLERVGRLVAETLGFLRPRVRPGVSTAEIDAAAEDYLVARGASSGPQRDYRFPGFICVSVNDELVHGVPGPRRIEPGDLVKLDVTAECAGYVADAALTVPVEPVSDGARRLVAAVREAFEAAMRVTHDGAPIAGLGRAIETTARRRGVHVVRELTGHGVGRRVHEPPEIPNFEDPRSPGVLRLGQVIAVEPIFAAGPGRVVEGADGWTLRTEHGVLGAHHEHTLVVGRHGPRLLTAA